MLFVTPCTSMETDTNKKIPAAEWNWRRKSQLEESHVLYRGQKKVSFNIIFVQNWKFYHLIGPF